MTAMSAHHTSGERNRSQPIAHALVVAVEERLYGAIHVAQMCAIDADVVGSHLGRSVSERAAEIGAGLV
jgi:hypothetical protein